MSIPLLGPAFSWLHTAWQRGQLKEAFLSQEAPGLVQFMKYALSGLMAALTHHVVLLVLALTFFPVAKGSLMDGVPLTDALRGRHLLYNNTLAWPVGTWVAYWLNVNFVFVPGRRSRRVEKLLFWAVSAVGFFPAVLLAEQMASSLHLPARYCQLGFLVTSVLVNFACRKLVIFQR
jgi:putative flippase GtrA